MLAAARLTRTDAVLAVLAIVGALALAVLLPRQHPDTAASFALTQAGAEARATVLLDASGYAVEGLEPSAIYDGSGSLMDSLHEALGGEQATAALREAAGRLPAFRWRVVYERPLEPGERAFSQAPFAVDLGSDGRLWRLENAMGALPERVLDRRAVDRKLLPSADVSSETLPEAHRFAPLVFALDSVGVDLDDGWEADVETERRQLALSGTRALGAAAAAWLAARTLTGTGYEGLGLRPVRVEPVERRPAAARVRLEADERVWGQRVAVDVTVTPAGDLLQLEPRFNEAPGAADGGVTVSEPAAQPPRAEGGTRATITVSEDVPWTTVGALAAWVVLSVGFLVMFVRRLMVQALDLRAALVDAAAVGLAVACYPLLLLPIMERVYPFDGIQLALVVAVGTLLWVAGAGVMTVVASGVSDSLMRARRREKLDAIALVRQGRLLNRPVGASLLRGALAAGALLGLAAVLWTLLPLRPAYGDDGWSAYQLSFSPGLLVFTQAFWFQTVVGLALFGGVGAVLMGAGSRWVEASGAARTAVVVLGLAAGGALLNVGPGSFSSEPVWAVWAYGGVYAAAVGLVVWRFDVFAALVAFVLAEAAWRLAPALWAEAAPFGVDAAVLLALIPFVGLVGAVGIRRTPRREVLGRYVPAYITELAERERLHREVEIAREVQRSFLPATMPDVPGLDLAAVCIPAEEVGGDYYDAFPIPDPEGGPSRLAVVVGDVSGKGIQGAFYMTLVKGVLRTLAPSGLGPAGVLLRLNEVFTENARSGAFVSAIYGVIDPVAGTFTYARAGHNPLLVRRHANGRAAEVESRRPAGLAVGLTAGHAFAQTLQEDTVHLQPGDALILYTDGFSEAMDAGRALYTDARLVRLFAGAEDDGAAALVGHAVADVRAFASGDANPDDMTMLVARLTG